MEIIKKRVNNGSIIKYLACLEVYGIINSCKLLQLETSDHNKITMKPYEAYNDMTINIPYVPSNNVSMVLSDNGFVDYKRRSINAKNMENHFMNRAGVFSVGLDFMESGFIEFKFPNYNITPNTHTQFYIVNGDSGRCTLRWVCDDKFVAIFVYSSHVCKLQNVQIGFNIIN